MTLFRRLALLSLLIPLALHAQSGSSQVDVLASFDMSVYNLVTSQSGLYVGLALGVVYKFGVGLFVIVMLIVGWEAVSRRDILNIDAIVRRFCIPYGVVVYGLQHWTTPIPGLGYSVVGVFTNVSADLAARAHIASVDIMQQHLMSMRDGLGTWHMLTKPVDMVAWACMTLLIIFAKAVVYIMVAIGEVGLGIGACLGPIFLLFFLWPPFRHKWYGWVEAMIKYSMYKVVAEIVITVWCGFVVSYLDNLLGGQYSVPNFIANFTSVGAIMIAFVFGCFRISHYVNDFNSGHASGGGNILGVVASAVRGVFL